MSSRTPTDALGTLWLWIDTHYRTLIQEVFHGRSTRTLAVPRGALRVPQHWRLRVSKRVDGDGKSEGQGGAVLSRHHAGLAVHASRGGARVPHHVVRTGDPHGAPRARRLLEGKGDDQKDLAGSAVSLRVYCG